MEKAKEKNENYARDHEKKHEGPCCRKCKTISQVSVISGIRRIKVELIGKFRTAGNF